MLQDYKIVLKRVNSTIFITGYHPTGNGKWTQDGATITSSNMNDALEAIKNVFSNELKEYENNY